MPGLEGRHLQTPFGRVAHVAPVIEGANATVTPVVEGVVAEVETTSDAVIIVAPAPEVVDVEIA